MPIRLVVLLFGLLLATTAVAETVTIKAPWTQVRRNPTPQSRAVDVVYGNDTFEVQEAKDGWAKITTPRKATGWVPIDPAAQALRATAPAPRQPRPQASPPADKPAKPAEKPNDKKAGAEPPATPKTPENLRATALANGISLRQLGYREQAREKFTDLMLNNPGTVEAYQATRQMLSYYLVGYLPPVQGGKITDEGLANIGPVTSEVLLQEAIALQAEKHYPASARIYQRLVEQNRDNGRAFLGLLDTLRNAMAESLRDQKQQDLNAQAAAFKKFFPDIPLPDGVQQRLAQGGK